MNNDYDTIINHTTTQFGIVDRFKILIGGKAHLRTEIETKNERVVVRKSETETSVSWPSWFNYFKRKPKGFIYSSPDLIKE